MMRTNMLIGTVVCVIAQFAAVADEIDIDKLCPPRSETAARFEPGAYPPAARPYRDAARMIYDYMTKLPGMTTLVETGKPNQKYQHNAYVSKTHAAHVFAMLSWARFDSAQRETAMRFAKASAEFLLGELEPANAPLAYWPPTYGRKPLEFDPKTDGPYKKDSMIGNEPEGAVKYRGEVMLLYPADVGTAFVAYYEATQDARFLEAARHIGETYLKTRRPDGSWPLKMKLATGEPIGENTLVPNRVLVFFEKLYAVSREQIWRKAADDAFAWLEAHPLKDWNWDGQFEDIKPLKPYLNPTKHNACDILMYMLDRFPGDTTRLALCRRLLEFCEKRFVVWKAPANHPGWPAPSVLEQYSCFTPIDASAAKMIRTYVAMYRAEGRVEDAQKACALADTITRQQLPSGRVPTFWDANCGLTGERYDWLNCMAASAEALLVADAWCVRAGTMKDGEALTLPRGEISLREANCRTMWLDPSNNGSGFKRVAFPLVGKSNVTIDGQGATIVCEEKVFPFAALGCTNVTLRNFTVTTRFPSCAGFVVESKDDAGFIVKFDAGVCPYRVENGNIFFALNGHEVSTGQGRLSLHALDRIAIHYLMTPDAPGDKSEFPSTFVGVVPEDLGDGRVRFRYYGDRHAKSIKLPYAVGERVVVNLEERRERDVFFFQDCDGVCVENVTIRRFGGMGIVGQRSGNIAVKGLVALPEDDERVTLTADTMQFINCFGQLTIEDCRCAYSLDDVINIHGNYLKVEKTDGRVATLRAMHRSHEGFFPYRPGDLVAFTDARTRDVRLRAHVVAVQPDHANRFVCQLVVDTDLPTYPAKTLVENETLNPDVVIRRNDFHDHPNIRLSGRGKYLVEGNRIARSSSAIVGMDLAEYWYESGRILDMTIRDNTFSDCNRLGGRTFLSFGVSGWGADAPKIHGRIRVEHNRFDKVRGKACAVSGVRQFEEIR